MAKKPVGSKKKAAPRTTKTKQQAREQAQKQMWALVLFVVGILLGVLTWVPGTKIWNVLHNTLFGLLGVSSYFVAPLCIYIAVMAAVDKPMAVLKNKRWQAGVLLLLISSTAEVFGGLPKVEGLPALLVALFKKGMEKQGGGGLLGVLFAGPLSLLGGPPVPQIIMVLALFIFVMLVTGNTLMSLYYLVAKPVKNVGEAYGENIESRKLQKEQRQQAKEEQITLEETAKQGTGKLDWKEATADRPKYAIDIDISDDRTPEDFDMAAPPLELLSKDLKGVSLNQADVVELVPPMEQTFVIPDFYSEPSEVEITPEEDPLAGFGIDLPVEYVNLSTLKSVEEPLPQQLEERPHPLIGDIDQAEQEDVLRVVQDYLDRIKTRDDDTEEEPLPEPEALFEQEPEEQEQEHIEIETFRANLTPLRPAVAPMPSFGGQRVEPTKPLTTVPLPQNPAASPEPQEPPEPSGYRLPPLTLLEQAVAPKKENITQELEENAKKLVATLESFGVQTKIIDIARGPSVTRYELQPSPGVKISRITGLADDIALNLAAAGIRIEAPIPNKAAVGIEVPNKNVTIVGIREIIGSNAFKESKTNVAMALGKDITGNCIVADIAKMPHMLIAGATGSGKSVCINSIVMSILYKYRPDEVKLLMIDPKVVELGVYNGIPHLLVPVVTDPKKAAGALSWAVQEMLKRYQTFAENGVRDLDGYNKQASKNKDMEKIPQVVIIIDELADLMMASPAEVEDSICRLAQMARAAGMHLVIATQRPSVDVITGVIKANIPSRIAFSVSSQVDSRTILDMGGAEKLLGRGDMLFYPSGAAKPLRVQGCFVKDSEVEKVVAFVKKSASADYDDAIVEEIDRLSTTESASAASGGGFDDEDEMIPYAIECVVELGQASTSMLQRRLKLGYARAARIIDQLEHRGIVGPFEGSKPRQLLITKDQYLEMKLAGLDQPGAFKGDS